MERVSGNEARTQFPRLLERAAEGQWVTITKHGVPIAVLGPYDTARSADTEAIIKQLLEFRENNTLSGLTIRPWIEEGRR